MTIHLPEYARRQPMRWLWFKGWKLRRLVKSYRRNPDCNENRRYRDDTRFVLGEHRHIEPLYLGGHRFERVAVPFRPFKLSPDTTLNKEDLLYLRINTVEQPQDAAKQAALKQEDAQWVRRINEMTDGDS